MMTILFLIYVFLGLVVYALTDTPSVAAEFASRNVLLTFGDVNKFLIMFAIALWASVAHHLCQSEDVKIM